MISEKKQTVLSFFLIPPVYETGRHSISDDIFSKALELTPECRVVDHRKKYRDKEYFHHYDHLNSFYFIEVFEEIALRGWLNPSQ